VVCPDLSGDTGNVDGLDSSSWVDAVLFLLHHGVTDLDAMRPFPGCIISEALSLRCAGTMPAAQRVSGQVIRPLVARHSSMSLPIVTPLTGDSGTAQEACRRCGLPPFDLGQLRCAAL